MYILGKKYLLFDFAFSSTTIIGDILLSDNLSTVKDGEKANAGLG